jgi:putative endonuclease
MTDNICRRLLEHKLKIKEECFTAKYNVDKLVYYEEYDNFEESVNREKQLKAGSRKKKINLVAGFNPDWHDLYSEICSKD